MIIESDYSKVEIKKGRTGWLFAFYSREIGGRFGERWHVPYSALGRTMSVPRPAKRDTDLTHDEAIHIISMVHMGHAGRMLARGSVVR